MQEDADAVGVQIAEMQHRHVRQAFEQPADRRRIPARDADEQPAVNRREIAERAEVLDERHGAQGPGEFEPVLQRALWERNLTEHRREVDRAAGRSRHEPLRRTQPDRAIVRGLDVAERREPTRHARIRREKLSITACRWARVPSSRRMTVADAMVVLRTPTWLISVRLSATYSQNA
jgi:hypothetical protein